MTGRGPQALIFDLDGVVADTEALHYASWQRLADAEGVAFDRAANAALLGRTREDSLRIFAGTRDLDAATAADWLARKQGWFVESLASMTPADALPGVPALIDEARAAGLGLGLASSSRNARAVLGQLGLLDRFEVVADGATVTLAKPAPDVFLWVADRLGVPPGNCIVFEDSPAGVAAAQAAGCIVVGLGAHVRPPRWRASLAGARLADFPTCVRNDILPP